MIATLRQRNFFLLWLAGLISITGNWMLSIALPVTVYAMTGSALAVGGLLLARTLPSILFSSIGGVLVDRWERRRTLVAVNLLLAITLLPLLLVTSAEMLWLIYAVTFVQSLLSQLFAPAENAMLPLLSDPEHLVSANALNALNNNLARLIGPAIGGILAPLVGLSGVAIVDAITFIVAGLLCLLITVTSHPAGENTTDEIPTFRKFLQDWWDGIQLIWRKRTVRILFMVSVLPAIGESVMYVLFVPFVTEVLRGDALHVGGLMSAQAIGGIIGGMMIGRIAQRVPTTRLLGFSAILFALTDFAIFNYPSIFSGIALAYGLFILAGPLAVSMGASFATLQQTHVEDAYRGRIFGTFSFTSSLFTLVVIAITGLLADNVGIVPIINIQAYAYFLLGIFILRAFWKQPSEARTFALQET